MLLGVGIIISKADIEYAIEKGILKREGARKISYLNKMSWSTRREYFKLYEDNNKSLPLLRDKIMTERHKDILATKILD